MRTKMKYYKIILILFLAFIFQANDSVLNSSGGDLFPILESDIEMQKEVLKLRLLDEMYVDVYFEFYNPTDEKELTVGFVVPPKYSPDYADNDSIQIEERKPDIKNFSVIINDSITDYKFGLLKNTPFEEVTKIEGKWNYVYYFKATFKRGLNIIKHSYSFNGGYDSSGGRFYNYVLKTAKNWSGAKIWDFTLQIDMGSDIQFELMEPISMYDNWSIIGSGKRKGNDFYIREGYIELKENDFTPENDINVYIPGRIVDFMDVESVAYQAEVATQDELESLDTNRLRTLRNYFYAREGYKFKSNDLLKFYSNYIWYIPIVDLTSEEIYDSMSTNTKNRIEMIRGLEQLRK